LTVALTSALKIVDGQHRLAEDAAERPAFDLAMQRHDGVPAVFVSQGDVRTALANLLEPDSL
jgi:hypothetical protein